jgi:hypothetical protein
MIIQSKLKHLQQTFKLIPDKQRRQNRRRLKGSGNIIQFLFVGNVCFFFPNRSYFHYALFMDLQGQRNNLFYYYIILLFYNKFLCLTIVYILSVLEDTA